MKTNSWHDQELHKGQEHENSMQSLDLEVEKAVWLVPDPTHFLD
jgi:hypothetical protein